MQLGERGNYRDISNRDRGNSNQLSNEMATCLDSRVKLVLLTQLFLFSSVYSQLLAVTGHGKCQTTQPRLS